MAFKGDHQPGVAPARIGELVAETVFHDMRLIGKAFDISNNEL
jgi:hypothetical protein